MPTVGLSIPSAGITERKMKLLTQNFDLAHCEGSSFTEAHNTSIEFDMEHAKEFAKKVLQAFNLTESKTEVQYTGYYHIGYFDEED